MPTSPDALAAALTNAPGAPFTAVTVALGEVTAQVSAERLLEAMRALKVRPEFHFETLIDLCAVDYSTYADGAHEGPRFAVVYHLLSLANNCRARIRCFAPDNEFPVVPSVVDLWPVANWFEREAFDLFGVMFPGHPDLRRILTDYGFVGHPFRKDFPISGHVEMRYDPEQRRVVYQPVTIEPREITPRIIREDSYAAGG